MSPRNRPKSSTSRSPASDASGLPRASEGEDDFFDRVYKVVACIPEGSVTTYGHVARHLGLASAARTVGWALNGAAASGLPCHRVVNRFGALTGRLKFGNPHVMEDLLRNEGVTFDDDGCVDLAAHLWDPADDPDAGGV